MDAGGFLLFTISLGTAWLIYVTNGTDGLQSVLTAHNLGRQDSSGNSQSKLDLTLDADGGLVSQSETPLQQQAEIPTPDVDPNDLPDPNQLWPQSRSQPSLELNTPASGTTDESSDNIVSATYDGSNNTPMFRLASDETTSVPAFDSAPAVDTSQDEPVGFTSPILPQLDTDQEITDSNPTAFADTPAEANSFDGSSAEANYGGADSFDAGSSTPALTNDSTLPSDSGAEPLLSGDYSDSVMDTDNPFESSEPSLDKTTSDSVPSASLGGPIFDAGEFDEDTAAPYVDNTPNLPRDSNGDEDFPDIGAAIVGDNPVSDQDNSEDGFVLEQGIVIEQNEYDPIPQPEKDADAGSDTDADSGMEQNPDADPSPLTTGDNQRGIWWDAGHRRELFHRSQTRALTLYEALSLAVTMAPDLQVLNADMEIAKHVVREESAAFDWTTFLESAWNQDSTPVSSSLDGAQRRIRERNWTMRGGVRRRNDLGGQVAIGQQFGIRNSNSQFISPNNQGTGRLTADYTQPLLRGHGRNINRAGISISELNRDIAEDNMMAGVESHLFDVASAYWNLSLQRSRLVQAERALERAMQLVKFMKNRQQIDVRQNQLIRAEGAALQIESIVVEAEHDAKTSQETLLRLIYGSQFSGFSDFEVIPTTTLEEMPVHSDIDFEVEQALKNRSEIQAAIRSIRTATIRSRIAENDILPQLDLVLSGYAAGLHPRNDIGNAFRNQFTEGEPGFSAGFNFEFPYHNRAAKAVSDQQQIAIKRFEKEFETVVADVTLDVRSEFLNVERNLQLTMVNEQRLKRTAQELDVLEKRFELLIDGTRVSDLYLDNLVQSQQRLVDSEYGLLLARTQLALSQIRLIRGKGMLHTLSMQANTATPHQIPQHPSQQQMMHYENQYPVQPNSGHHDINNPIEGGEYYLPPTQQPHAPPTQQPHAPLKRVPTPPQRPARQNPARPAPAPVTNEQLPMASGRYNSYRE